MTNTVERRKLFFNRSRDERIFIVFADLLLPILCYINILYKF